MSSSRTSRRAEFFALVDEVGDLPSSGLATSGLVEVSPTAQRAAEVLMGGLQRPPNWVSRLAYELGQLEVAEKADQVVPTTVRPGSPTRAARSG